MRRRNACAGLAVFADRASAALRSPPPVKAAEPVSSEALEILSHYDYPPFVTGHAEGLSHDWADWLSTRLGIPAPGLHILPRKRLDLLMNQPHWQGIVPWVIPEWFGDTDMQRYHWSPPVLEDADLVLSLRSSPVDELTPTRLRGLRFGAVLGHVYADMNGLIAQGRLRREDALNTEQNLRKLLLGRVDFVFLSRSGLPWWLQKLPEFREQLHVAATPRLHFQRRMLLSAQLPAPLRGQLLDAIAHMHRDSAWQTALSRYGLEAQARLPGRSEHEPDQRQA
ncbi:substrate-binding periplasmic protein [Paucibacter soli]|uniref:substrate-binding periplasmic protein n=1 Tax=Paucibacter soli TaxID=3133433 RepID=UPI0030AD042C